MATLRHAQTHAPRRKEMCLELNRFYVLEETAKIIGADRDDLQRRLHRYKHVTREPTFSWIMISGETIARILTGMGTKWEYENEIREQRKVA